MTIDPHDKNLDGCAVYMAFASVMDAHVNAFEGMALRNVHRGDGYRGDDWDYKKFSVIWELGEKSRHHASRDMTIDQKGNLLEVEDYCFDTGNEPYIVRTAYFDAAAGLKRRETHMHSLWGECKQGMDMRWHTNGKIKSIGHYQKNKRHGRFSEFDENGQMIANAWYDQGQPVDYKWELDDEDVIVSKFQPAHWKEVLVSGPVLF